MFGSAILDLAIGLIFCFLAVSLATGAIVEALASITKWRARTLREGIGQLLNDPQMRGLAAELYAHAAINPRGPGQAAPTRHQPAYIDRQLFANALMDLTGISRQAAAATGQASRPEQRPTLEALRGAVTAKCREIANPQLEQLLTGIVDRSFGDVDKIRTDLSTWFDSAMDRVSGAYKRTAQLVGFIAALILAVGLNIDTIGVAKALWVQPKLVEQLNLPRASSSSALASSDPGAATPATPGPSTGVGPDPRALLTQLDTTLPVGWPNGLWRGTDGSPLTAGAFAIAAVGWLITALSTVFGAPFWFDLLQNVVRLKGSGPSPGEKADGKGAAA